MTVGCRNPCDDIERLCVCGTCNLFYAWPNGKGWVNAPECGGLGVGETLKQCQFTPSKWRPYWETSDAT